MKSDPVSNPYVVLGVEPMATAEEIKRAYHRQVKEHHPDRAGASPDAHARTVAINAAYAALCTPEARAATDARLRVTVATTPRAPAGASQSARVSWPEPPPELVKVAPLMAAMMQLPRRHSLLWWIGVAAGAAGDLGVALAEDRARAEADARAVSTRRRRRERKAARRRRTRG